MKKINYKKVLPILLCIMIAFFSMKILTPVFTSPKTYQKTIQSLEKKKKVVLALTAATTATSVAISLLPGDAGTPIADKAADVSSYLVIVLCTIFFEKYMLTVLGGATFFVLIPLICALWIACNLTGQKQFIKLGIKVSFFALVLSTAIPLSIKISDMIEDTYQSSIESTVKDVNKAADEIRDKSNEEKSVFEEFVSKIKNGAGGILKTMEKKINNLVEAMAVMIVTTCLIPIAVVILFIWLCKIILGIQITLPNKKEKQI